MTRIHTRLTKPSRITLNSTKLTKHHFISEQTIPSVCQRNSAFREHWSDLIHIQTSRYNAWPRSCAKHSLLRREYLNGSQTSRVDDPSSFDMLSLTSPFKYNALLKLYLDPVECTILFLDLCQLFKRRPHLRKVIEFINNSFCFVWVRVKVYGESQSIEYVTSERGLSAPCDGEAAMIFYMWRQ